MLSVCLRGARTTTLAVGLGAILLAGLAACAPGGASGASGSDSALRGVGQTSGARNGATTVHAAPAPQPTRLGAADPAQTLNLSFPLAQRSSSQLSALLAAIADPHSPHYHHYLTAAQYSAAYGASAEQRARAVAAIQALGLEVSASPADSNLIQATGTVARIQSDFDLTLSSYRAADGTRYVAPDRAPRLSAPLAGLVTGVIGLDTRPAVKPFVSQSAASGTDGGLDPSALRQVYDVAPLTNKGLDGSVGRRLRWPRLTSTVSQMWRSMIAPSPSVARRRRRLSRSRAPRLPARSQR